MLCVMHEWNKWGVFVVLIADLKHHHIPVEEFNAPDIQQMYNFASIVCNASAKQEVWVETTELL